MIRRGEILNRLDPACYTTSMDEAYTEKRRMGQETELGIKLPPEPGKSLKDRISKTSRHETFEGRLNPDFYLD